jgi:small subunit ribosomal protein S17
MNTEQKKPGRILKGVIVSAKMTKTVVVAITRLKLHPKYKQRYKVTKRFKAHVDSDTFKVGDTVFITETRPISKEVRWLVLPQ